MPIIFPSNLIGSAIKQLQQRIDGSAPSVKKEFHPWLKIKDKSSQIINKVKSAEINLADIQLNPIKKNQSLLNFGSKLEIYSLLATEPLLGEVLDSIVELKANPEKSIIKMRQELFPNNRVGLPQSFQAAGINHIPIFRSQMDIERSADNSDSYLVNLYLENRQTSQNYINKISLPVLGYDSQLGNGVYIDIFDTIKDNLFGLDFIENLLKKSSV